MPTSYKTGKPAARDWMKSFPRESVALDIGPGKGTYAKLVDGYFSAMDAIEIEKKYVDKFRLLEQYRHVFLMSVMDFPATAFERYDIAVMGDVLEHLTVDDAQKVLKRMECIQNLMVAVPFEYEQGAVNGVESEIHLQPELTPELFDHRYPGFRCLKMLMKEGKPYYGYYVR